MELAMQREREQKYEAQADKTTDECTSQQEDEDCMTIAPVPASFSCKQYNQNEVKTAPGTPTASVPVEQEKDTNATRLGPIVGLKQRFLAYLFRQASQSAEPSYHYILCRMQVFRI